MHKSIANLIDIKKKINLKKKDLDFETKIIAVSKTFPMKDILPLIEFGHIHYGENKVQEAIEKWTNIKSNNKNIKLNEGIEYSFFTKREFFRGFKYSKKLKKNCGVVKNQIMRKFYFRTSSF